MTDPEIFKKNILELNQQLAPSAIRTENLQTLKGLTPDVIVLVGMGGSGTPGAILQNLTEYANIDIPLVSWRDFGLPTPGAGLPASFKRPFYIFVSFSGGTRETLSGFSALPQASAAAVVAGGGGLLEGARKNGLALATFSEAFDKNTLQPRQGYGLTLSGVLAILRAMGIAVPVKDYSTVIAPQAHEAEGKAIAQQIVKTLPFIYTSNALSHVGQIFKISLNESGKFPASANVFPEINHNELSIFETKPKGMSALLITTKAEQQKLEKEITIIKKILAEYEVPTSIIEVPGNDSFEISVNAIVLAEWVGYYIATMRGLNPLSIQTVNRIKELTA